MSGISSAAQYLRVEDVGVVGVVGTGSVGASWIALLLARGFDVVAQDPAADAQARARAFVAGAWPALCAIGIARTAAPPLERLKFVNSAGAVAEAADLIQENVPEKPSIKDAVLREIDAAAAPQKIIASSTGGIPPSALQASCARHPERLVVMHPFNPAHLIPLVEVVGGRKTAPEVVKWAIAFCRFIGKRPIEIKREASGHMANRLQFALLREAVHCLNEGYASAEDIDAAVRYGLGPRWALMGSLLTLHLAGGPGGMKGILDHAGDAIDGWWAALGKPELNADTRAKLVEAAQEISAGRSIGDWIQWRDDKLAGIIQLMQTAPIYEKPGADSAEQPR